MGMVDIYMKIKRSDYRKLVEDCETLKKENAKLKRELEKATASKEVAKNEKADTKAETKKGGK